jgi:deferrochelatase/peroxidase EfeB
MAQSAVTGNLALRFGDPEFDDVQGIARFGYGHLSAACFYLLRITDVASARQWLGDAPVSNAVLRDTPPESALQLAFSTEGLQALGLPPAALNGFSAEFLSGMAGDEARSRRLGDIAANSPGSWLWGSGGFVPHVLAMVYATPALFEAWKRELTGPLWRRAFSVLECLDTSDMGGHEPFGFVDGISQPVFDWERRLDLQDVEAEYRNLTMLGELLLGYPNEYGKYTDRPLIEASADPEGLLPTAEGMPDKRDLGRNGTYLVFRDLRQDVRGFWRFLAGEAAMANRSPQELAEAMVGRTMEGDPLVPPLEEPIVGVEPGVEGRRNRFTFGSDPEAAHCPFGAHIRRANPRTADVPPGTVGALKRVVQTLGLVSQEPRNDVIASARFHRILRRGREYGPQLSPDDALQPSSGDEDRGLRFLCLNANIARQFEFVQNAWLIGTKFGGLTEESDPLLGNRQAIAGSRLTDAFSYARDAGLRRRLRGLPQFVTVRGGGYFFLPGLRALNYLARRV